jgi:hypothetical protein
MSLVQVFESGHVACGSLLRQLIVCRLLRYVGFGCSHVFICSGKLKEILQFPKLVGHDYHASASFKGRHHSSLHPWGLGSEIVALNAAVMRRFERVVALPNLKMWSSADQMHTAGPFGLKHGASAETQHSFRKMRSKTPCYFRGDYNGWSAG